MKVRGPGFVAALLLMALAPSIAFAGLSGSDGTTIHANADVINAALAQGNSPAILDPDKQAKGRKEAGAYVTAAKIPCTMTDAYYIGGGAGADKVYTDYYEVACKEGLGYALAVKKNNPTPEAFDCVIMARTPDGKPSPQACRLAGNRNPVLGLQAMVTKAGHTCTVNKGRFVGPTQDVFIYEVGCSEGGGYVLEASRQVGGAPKTTNCLIYGAGAGGIKCAATSDAEQNAYVDKMVAAGGKPCAVTGRRYVGSTPDGADFFEVACSDASGYMIKTAANGGFANLIPCAQASVIGDGCKLTDARQAMTKEAGLYSGLSRKAGFDCEVSKYAAFDTGNTNTEVVELACSNRPDGGIGFFPAGAGQARVLDCLRAEAEGYKCSFSQTASLFAKLTEQLRAKGKTSCVVSNAAAYAVADAAGGGKDDFVEVACADGGPGLVLHYSPGQALPIELLNCAEVQSSGGCKLSKIS